MSENFKIGFYICHDCVAISPVRYSLSDTDLMAVCDYCNTYRQVYEIKKVENPIKREQEIDKSREEIRQGNVNQYLLEKIDHIEELLESIAGLLFDINENSNRRD